MNRFCHQNTQDSNHSNNHNNHNNPSYHLSF